MVDKYRCKTVLLDSRGAIIKKETNKKRKIKGIWRDDMLEIKEFVAHIDVEGNEQSIKEHLIGTAKGAGQFAAEFAFYSHS